MKYKLDKNIFYFKKYITLSFSIHGFKWLINIDYFAKISSCNIAPTISKISKLVGDK